MQVLIKNKQEIPEKTYTKKNKQYQHDQSHTQYFIQIRTRVLYGN